MNAKLQKHFSKTKVRKSLRIHRGKKEKKYIIIIKKKTHRKMLWDLNCLHNMTQGVQLK